jgi:four helix bundle protein
MTKFQGKPNNQVVPGGFHWSDDNGLATGYMLREENGDPVRRYDLAERTARFGEAIVNRRLIDQLVGAGTAIGANYCEADDGVSRRDFHNKIGTCRKEAKETKFFLRMIGTAEEDLRDEARALWKEARELHLIFCAIFRK